MGRFVSSSSYTTSVAAESTACVHRFCKRFPVGSRRAVSEIVAVYGIRALLAEVPFERLTLGDINSAADLAIRDLDSILASDKSSRIKRGLHRVARPCKPRSDVARAWPFVDDIGGVEDVLSGDQNLNSENRLSFEKLPAREQIRRCKAMYSNFRRGRDALPAEFVSLALEDLVGSPPESSDARRLLPEERELLIAPAVSDALPEITQRRQRQNCPTLQTTTTSGTRLVRTTKSSRSRSLLVSYRKIIFPRRKKKST